jgi:O-antigen ligase
MLGTAKNATRLAGQTAIAVYLVAVPLSAVLIDRIGGHDIARVAQVSLALLCAAVVLCCRSKEASREPVVHLLARVLIGCLAIAAAICAAVPAMATREIALFAGMAAIALATSEMRDPVDWPAHVVSVASAAYVAVILLIIVAGYLAGQPLNRAEVFVGYDNYRFFNHVQTAGLPLAVLALTIARKRSWAHVVAGFAAIGGFALLFALAGRGTLMGIAVACVAVGLLFGRSAMPLLKNLACTGILGLTLFAVLFWLMPLLMGFEPEFSENYYGSRLGSVDARLFLWGIAMSYIEQSPWLGIGPMHYAHLHNAEAAHPHNIYLQVAAEWGVPMLLLVLTVAGVALRRFALAIRRCNDQRRRDCGIGLFLACVAIAVDGLFSGNFVMPVSQVWIAFTIGWAMAWMRHQAPDGASPVATGHHGPHRVMAIGLLTTQLWLVWSVWPEILQLDLHVQQTMERVPNPTMNPRFWSHGWF